MNLAGREMEVKAVQRSDVLKIIGDDGVAMYKGKYHRSKMTGAADSDEQYFLSLANWKLSAWTNT